MKIIADELEFHASDRSLWHTTCGDALVNFDYYRKRFTEEETTATQVTAHINITRLAMRCLWLDLYIKNWPVHAQKSSSLMSFVVSMTQSISKPYSLKNLGATASKYKAPRPNPKGLFPPSPRASRVTTASHRCDVWVLNWGIQPLGP